MNYKKIKQRIQDSDNTEQDTLVLKLISEKNNGDGYNSEKECTLLKFKGNVKYRGDLKFSSDDLFNLAYFGAVRAIRKGVEFSIKFDQTQTDYFLQVGDDKTKLWDTDSWDNILTN